MTKKIIKLIPTKLILRILYRAKLRIPLNPASHKRSLFQAYPDTNSEKRISLYFADFAALRSSANR